MPVPNPTPIYRFIHVENLEIYLKRGGVINDLTRKKVESILQEFSSLHRHVAVRRQWYY